MGFDSIVVGVDGSEGAHAAMTWASGQIGSGRLVAVYGMSQWAEMAWASVQVDPSWILGEAKTLIEEEWCEPATRAGVECERVTLEEEPAAALMTAGDEVDADLLVVGSHSAAPWAPHYLGGVASKLLHKTRRPVAIVPRTYDPEASDRDAVVVGVDGSPASTAALGWAVAHAADTGGTVRAVWVVDERLFSVSDWAPAADHRQVEAAAAASLGEIVGGVLAEQGVSLPVDQAVRYATPASQLVEESETAGLVVLGLGPDRLSEIVLGSVPRRCATKSRCPVVMVPAGSTRGS